MEITQPSQAMGYHKQIKTKKLITTNTKLKDMPVVANKIIEKLEIAKDNFSEAIAREEGSKDSAISRAQEYLLSLRGYLETMRQRMIAKIKLMQNIKKTLLAEQSKSETKELPIYGTEGETRELPAVGVKRAATAKKSQTTIDQEKTLKKEIAAFKNLLNQTQDYLTNFNLAMTDYLLRVGNKYKFLILADEEVACLPALRGKLSREILEEIINLKTEWEYFTSLDTDLMETIMAWAMSADIKKSDLTSIDECMEILAEFAFFLIKVNSKIKKLGDRLKVQCSVHFEELMSVTYVLLKEAKSKLE